MTGTCVNCGELLTGRQRLYCSKDCSNSKPKKANIIGNAMYLPTGSLADIIKPAYNFSYKYVVVRVRIAKGHHKEGDYLIYPRPDWYVYKEEKHEQRC